MDTTAHLPAADHPAYLPATKSHLIWEVFYMVQLNANTLSSLNMARGVAPKTERVIQFGEGGFLRAFCD